MLNGPAVHWLGLVLMAAVASPHRCVQSCGPGEKRFLACIARLVNGQCEGGEVKLGELNWAGGQGISCWIHAKDGNTPRCIAAIGDRGSLARRPYCQCWEEPE